jgi:hypothetical protein
VPLLPPLDDQAAPDARAALEALHAKLGRVPNMYRTFAHAPKVLSAAVAMAQAVRSALARFEESAAHAEPERDVLRFAEQRSVEGRVDGAILDRLKLALSPEYLVVLAATVAQANFTSRFNNVFGAELP